MTHIDHAANSLRKLNDPKLSAIIEGSNGKPKWEVAEQLLMRLAKLVENGVVRNVEEVSVPSGQ
jgi:hypothetical protein